MKQRVINPGDLHHRVQWQTPQDTSDGTGGSVRLWVTQAELWSHIEPTTLNGREVAGHLDGVVSHKVIVRYREDIASGQRFLHKGRVLRILGASDMAAEGRFLTCLCEEERR